MNKRDANELVYRLTAKSLCKLSAATSRWEDLGLPKGLNKHQQGKVALAMLELSAKLESKYPEGKVVEGEVDGRIDK